VRLGFRDKSASSAVLPKLACHWRNGTFTDTGVFEKRDEVHTQHLVGRYQRLVAEIQFPNGSMVVISQERDAALFEGERTSAYGAQGGRRFMDHKGTAMT
jgi:hypothetical protein